mmetsp:Transcript_5589/g.13052  ORF Transcript_5589/g.13052 Transcript_5589/m.13052 type:complete len:225 (-) Transcript_5589:19-693(-)
MSHRELNISQDAPARVHKTLEADIRMQSTSPTPNMRGSPSPVGSDRSGYDSAENKLIRNLQHRFGIARRPSSTSPIARRSSSSSLLSSVPRRGSSEMDYSDSSRSRRVRGKRTSDADLRQSFTETGDLSPQPVSPIARSLPPAFPVTRALSSPLPASRMDLTALKESMQIETELIFSGKSSTSSSRKQNRLFGHGFSAFDHWMMLATVLMYLFALIGVLCAAAK